MKRISSLYKTSRSSESGGAFVEATIALPMFLGVLILSIYLLYFSFKLLRFQYGLSEATRETFTRDQSRRAEAKPALGGGTSGVSWKAFFDDELSTHAKEAQITLPADPVVIFTPCKGGISGWGCADGAEPGDSFSIQYTVKVDLLPNSIGGIELANITFKSKAVATIQMKQSE